ncbi:serine/threonine-protein phosphatase 4 regulatory subunit 4 isoform X2 [Chiloscyllium plagiosum]|uniref:serine/threonine-protein phosphatase 4 regulatory subunit 4 isoform X2 n=1 Tax=Chiloscyllium plagiosum TaxID=36176 RepID=UPI001CB870E5|nr:serine/threonine-protein phosphatase 4 regulatory subunit 4 isoform X2 [Chiloscyllium plagiosum]
MMDFNQENLFGQIEDLQELSFIERPVRRYLKTPEEIERLTVDEELNDIERAVYLLSNSSYQHSIVRNWGGGSVTSYQSPLSFSSSQIYRDFGREKVVFQKPTGDISSGQDVQRTSVVVNLPNLMRQNTSETIRRVVPKIREVLHVAGVEMQLAAAVSFLTILQEELVSITAYIHSFLPIILANLDHRDTVVSNAWLETLLTVINALPKETIRQEILSPLVSKAQLSQTVQSRLASCKILGKVARKFESHIIKRDILPLVKSLCQDVEYEVRSCMCRQLEFIAQGIGVEQTKTAILPELVELARDEGSSVRIAAFDTIVNLLVMFDSDDRTQIIFPLVMMFCEKSFKADESILAPLSHQLGKLCHGLSGNLTNEQHMWFLDFYKKFSTLGLQQENGQSDHTTQFYAADMDAKYVSVRQNCAYNLPAMILFVDPKCFYSELYPTFSTLCHDPETLVRRTVATGFHEVIKLLGSSVHTVHKELIALLQDESLEVLDALLDHLPEILRCVITGGDHPGSETKVHVPDLIPALSIAEQRAATSLKWRIHEKLLLTFSCLPQVISSDQIYYKFLPIMFRIMTTNNVLPVQRASARTLCVFVRYNRKQEQRQEICSKLVEQLGQGKSCWNRLRFLDTCECIMDLFSKAFFCKYFFLPVLELSNDPVPNVRIKFCYMLPKLKSALKLPADKHLLQQLELCVRKLLCQEKDKDVTAIVRIITLELDRMETSTESFPKRLQEKDLLDHKKEKEENLLLEMEDMEKRGESKLMNEKKLLSSFNKDGKRKTKLGRSRSLGGRVAPPKITTDKSTMKLTSAASNSQIATTTKNALLSFDGMLQSHSSSSGGTASLPTCSSRFYSTNSNEHKTNGSKDTLPKKFNLKSRKSNP